MEKFSNNHIEDSETERKIQAIEEELKNLHCQGKRPLTDYHWRKRAEGIVAVEEMSKHILTLKEVKEQVKRLRKGL